MKALLAVLLLATCSLAYSNALAVPTVAQRVGSCRQETLTTSLCSASQPLRCPR